ncbi:MAG: phenylalanine--tRNA ligase subunit beta [Lachnospiraceae bacterium]|nr:phenylalanine--tRNA ligase subunit beta [Lachnospiraceae bacterium]
MNASMSWLKAYVPDLNVSDTEFTDAMTLSGTKVEGYERRDKNLERIVVGKILKIEAHPDAEKLVVCQVDTGDAAARFDVKNENGVVQIVTGAKNMKEGDLVPTVLAGGKVAGGHDGGPMPEEGMAIKAGKLRGVESNGMMCSIEELGSTKDFYPEQPENGLYIFAPDSGVKPGDDAAEALGLHDTVFEFEVTSNRVDCYAMTGIAREAAATFGKALTLPEETVHETEENCSDYIKVEVRDADLCTRYCGRVCTDITIAPSPVWMQRRLASCGIRPINNLVDITNYVMLEYGQPMHAFDLSTVAGNQIIVRRAADGEKFITLDGQERTLDKDVLMICDAEKEIGIAGIMGGENSMITDSVKTVLFEAATFNGPNIRKSSKRIGLRTDSSSFFEKGLDPANAEAAINRACHLVEELGCGKVTKGIVEVCAPLPAQKRIAFDPERINALLGTEISREQMLAYFKPLEIAYDEAKNELVIPSFRQDLNALCDIAEEVVRFYGYDKTPTTLPASTVSSGKRTKQMEVEDCLKEVALYAGFSEGYSYSFESPKVFDKLQLPTDARERQAVKIVNPLGEDFSIMRTLPLNGVLGSLSINYNRRNKNVRLFECGNVYLPAALPLTELPDERMMLTLGFYTDENKGKSGEAFFELKGVVEEMLARLGMRVQGASGALSFCAPAAAQDGGCCGGDAACCEARPYLHPGRQARVCFTPSGKQDKDCVCLGYIGEVHPDVCEAYEIGARTYVAVIDIPALMPFASFDRIYHPLAKFPAVTRDISMTVPKTVTHAALEEMIRQRGGKLLESVSLFDIYEGAQIKEGFKSMAYALSFRDAARTLSDEDVAAAMKKILNGLESLGAELRS